MDGSDGQTDLRMSMPHNVGAFYRESTKPDGSALCLGDRQLLLLMQCWLFICKSCVPNCSWLSLYYDKEVLQQARNM